MRATQTAAAAAALGTVAGLAGLAVLLAGGSLAAGTAQVLVNLANLAGATLVLVMALRAARAAEGQVRRGWGCLAAAGACWVTGNLLWCWYQLLAVRQPFPSWADAAYLAALPFAAAALLLLQRLPGSAAGRTRVLLNGVLTAGCLLFASWHLLLGPLWDTVDGGLLNQLVVIAYPTADVVLLVLALRLLVRSRLPRGTSWLVVAGVVSYAAADAHLALATLRSDFGIGTPADVAWTAGYAGLGWAAALGGTRRTRGMTARGRVFEAFSPYAAVLLAAVVAAQAQVGSDPVLLGLGVLALTLVIAHQVLLLSENLVLTAGLEQAVGARTAELEESRQELSHLALHDPLTGLGNRTLLLSRLHQAVSRLAPSTECCAVLLLDLDDFKTTNDTLGHSSGDALLVAVAGRLREAARDEDAVARLGGDEFAVVLDRVPGPEAAVALAERLLTAMSVPLDVEGHAIVVSLSIGIVVGRHDDDADDLLRHADVAMYQSKGSGKGRYTLFAGEMHAEVLDRLQLKADMRRALDAGQFVLHYQAIVDMQSEEVLGVEALARWQHPERGLVSPAVFIPLAEETGLISALGRQVLQDACRTVQQWRTELGRPLTVSVNVSARQLRDTCFVAEVQRVLDDTGLPAGALTLEITESMLLGDATGPVATLHALRALGVHLALDDFGTGYSSLSHLKNLPVDHIKIDKSFIDGLREQDDHGRVWSRAVIELARHLGLTVTAEGIEVQAQATALRLLHCDLGQGFLFARPVPAAELLATLQAQVPSPRAAADDLPAAVLARA